MDKTSKLIEEKIKELTPQTLNLILTDQDNPLIKKSLYTWLEETFEAIQKSALEEGKAIGREERGKELMEMLPKERPMSVFSFVLKGEELERYMRYKGFNECRDNIKALLTPQND